MYQLEKYKGSSTKHTCPNCNQKGVFVRYIDESGSYLAIDVGRCDRESKCGYHYPPKQFFLDNSESGGKLPIKRTESFSGVRVLERKQVEQGTRQKEQPERTIPDFIPSDHIKQTLGNNEHNAFVQFLLNLFPDDIGLVKDVLNMYLIGAFEDYTCFPYLDQLNRICRGKLIRFNPNTGKRLKGNYNTHSLVAKLKRQGKIKEDFRYKQSFFGEHLLTKYPDLPIAIVEAEKTAVIAAICKGVFPDMVWLATGSKQSLKVDKLRRFRQKQIFLYPDGDGFKEWDETASQARRQGINVRISSVIEKQATETDKGEGFDLADYLISEQNRINKTNKFIDRYNSALEKVLSNQTLFEQFNIILDERIAINEIDQNLSPIEAETVAIQPQNIRQIVLSLV